MAALVAVPRGMNWPPLNQETSRVVAEVLRDVVRTKPADLLGYVAQKLEEKSGKDPSQFEAQFEECKRKPRTYVLEEVCPAGQDPLSWVPMRYNDDTILSMTQARALEITSDVRSGELVEDTNALFARARASFPELMYLKSSPELDLLAMQTLKALCLGCSSNANITEASLDDADSRLTFKSLSLVANARNNFFEQVKQDASLVDALFVCSFLLVVGRDSAFQQRYGGGLQSPELAVIHAIENEVGALPSYSWLDSEQRQLILAVLQGNFSLDMLMSVEVAPSHFAVVKDLLGESEKGIDFFLSALAVQHMTQCRSAAPTDANIELITMGAQCLRAVNKFTAAKAYQGLLKKRAAVHSWRLTENGLHRAKVRLCCFRGSEEDEAWKEMQLAVESLGPNEQMVIGNEIGKYQASAGAPMLVTSGASALMVNAGINNDVGLAPAVIAMSRALEAARQRVSNALSVKAVKLRLEMLAAKAGQYKNGDGTPFADTPFTLEDRGADEIIVKVPGM